MNLFYNLKKNNIINISNYLFGRKYLLKFLKSYWIITAYGICNILELNDEII